MIECKNNVTNSINIVHKAIINVDEAGVNVKESSAIFNYPINNLTFNSPVEFHCNRPFLFIIHDNLNKNIIFLGKLIKPD